MGSIVSYETHTTSAIRGQRAIIKSRYHKLKLSKKKKLQRLELALSIWLTQRLMQR